MNYFPFHIGDYLSATRHLSWEEDLAYRRVLDTYYTNEKPLPAEVKQVCRLILATTEQQREAVKTILEEFFELTPDGWINRRADAEILAMQGKQQKQRDRANAMWEKRRSATGISAAPDLNNAPAMPRHDKSDATALNNDANALPPTPTPTPIEIHSLSPLATACPHDKLIDLYAQHLPNLPQPRKSLWLKSKNAPALRSRWQWVMTECHESGARKGIRLATTEEEGLEWFSKFFGYVNDSDFLTGRNGKFTGCDLGWLMTLDNFSKTLQGNYHPVKAAA